MAVKLFPTLEAAEAHILKHELMYTVKYVSRKQDKSFTQPIDAEKLGKKQKRFIMRYPSIVIGVKVMHCKNGRDMAVKSKAKRMALSKKLSNADHAYKRQTRNITQDTIKMDCPAILKIQRIVRFPDYKLATGKESRRQKKFMLDQLRVCKEPLRCEEVFQLTLPSVNCHSTHNVGKVLQNLGKADKTTDERFEDHVARFTRQQAVAVRLHKEVKHYVNCVKAMTVASKNLLAVIQDTCESEWVDVHNIDSALQSLDMLYSNYEAELFERVCSDLHTYIELFNPMKEKINKRRRKLLDYDNAKHSHENAFNAKKPDEIKVAKTLESLKQAERHYNDLNSELHRELPKFYKYRVDFIASNLSRLYSTESTFHLETGKITDELYNLMEQVPRGDDSAFGNAADNAVYNAIDQSGLDLSNLDHSMHSPSSNMKASHRASLPESDRGDDEYSPIAYNDCTEPHSMSYHEQQREAGTIDTSPAGSTVQVPSHGDAVDENSQAEVDDSSHHLPSSNPATSNSATAESNQPSRRVGSVVTEKSSNSLAKSDTEEGVVLLAESAVASDYDVPPSITAADRGSGGSHDYKTPPADDGDNVEEDSTYQNIDIPKRAEPGPEPRPEVASQLIGQQVLATHTYTAVDEDELSFDAGEIIDVVEFDDPDDQDEGWLMGISRKTGLKGVFPENFTRNIIAKKTLDI